jgi:hypothetical protein
MLDAAQSAPVARSPRPLTAGDRLMLPMHKSAVVQTGLDEAGFPELRLFYDRRTITFDEPELFPVIEAMTGQLEFHAGDALGWAPDAEWTRVRPMLEDLLDAGVLHRADDRAPACPIRTTPGERPSPIPPGPSRTVRSWFDCEAITAELAGRPIEPGWLEMVVPIFRVAHTALDADGRQVGEANVFPQALRIEVPTKWQACLFSGTRHQIEKPMNVTALKAMRTHWPAMMAVLLKVRARYLERFPDARDGWTVGHLERLATAVLALPSYQLMRCDRPVAMGELHPALSSLFRVTDGLRMTLHEMLFVPVGEPTRHPDAPVTSAEIHDYAERNYSFHSPHGVCAGPKVMVEQFLATIVDGRPLDEPAELEEALIEALSVLDRAFDYAMLGLQTYAVEFSIWPDMVRTYAALAEASQDWDGHGSAEAFRDRMAGHVRHIAAASYLADEADRTAREAVYEDMYRNCGFGLTGLYPGRGLGERLANPQTLTDTFAENLRRRLGEVLPDAPASGLERITAILLRFIGRVQAMLALAGEVQVSTSALLGRPWPKRLFDSRDLDVHNRLQGAHERRLPYLFDELRDLLGEEIVVNVHGPFFEGVQDQAATCVSS